MNHGGRLTYRLDHGIAHRAAIGLVALATDPTVESEWRRLLDLDGVAFFTSRIMNSPIVNPANLKTMEGGLSEAAARILPGFPLDAIAYACTSAAMLIGEEEVFRRIRAVRPGIPCTSPITAAKAALRALTVSNIALLTPYIDEINRSMREYLEQSGLKVPVMASFNNDNDVEVGRIALESIRDGVLELGRDARVEGVFVSCTTLRGAVLIESLEAELQKPVITSCYALAWHALRLAGYSDPVGGRGQLFERALFLADAPL